MTFPRTFNSTKELVMTDLKNKLTQAVSLYQSDVLIVSFSTNKYFPIDNKSLISGVCDR